MESLYLTDLIDRSTLQKVQDAFSDMVGMAALTTDSTGHPVTEPSKFTNYCANYTRKSQIGCGRCEECDRYGAIITQRSRKPTSYLCHSGLIEFAAPILANGEMVGSFIGGQVLIEKPNEEMIRKIAEDIGVNPDEYWEAIQQVQILPKERIDKAADFLFSVASVLSEMAMSKHRALLANSEIERAAQMKTDFLANMSHEIRTPMNAVIGMAEMALREDLPDNAKDYINQIKSSGRALLAIINDILDFSKIESGKMDIFPIEYDTMSLFNDVSNIIMTRLVDKDVDLVLDMAPDIPVLLYGDNIRIRQTLINLANNAVKFTNKGEIRIIVRFKRGNDNEGVLQISVVDTGIGIKQEDLQTIFESFSQVDSTRNRNVEGSGLGLAITQRLVTLMNGTLTVDSEYNVGSTFSISIPQYISDPTPAMQVVSPENKCALSLFKDENMSKHFLYDVKRLGVQAYNLNINDEIESGYTSMHQLDPDIEFFLFFEFDMMTDELIAFFEHHPEVHAILVSGFIQNHKNRIPNMLTIKKPLSSMNLSMIFNKEKVIFSGRSEYDDDCDFTAPDAWVLIVDDNAVNLTVAEGLLEPLNLNTVSATSGKEAIKRACERRYDLILMDHMMPEMDGITATKEIRSRIPEYENIPILALTANAVGSAREMFLDAGMNDFIAKPIEVRTLLSKLRQWLPADKIVKMSAEEIEEHHAQSQEDATIQIGDLDTATAIRMLGSEKLFWNVLKEYHRVIHTKADSILNHYMAENWNAYTIEVHALKSSSKQIGAMELSTLAADLERAGKEEDYTFIHNHTQDALTKYRSYEPMLAPYFTEEALANKPFIDFSELSQLFADLRNAVDELDSDEMEAISNKICSYQYPDEQQDFPEKLKNACQDIDVDAVLDIIDGWEVYIP